MRSLIVFLIRKRLGLKRNEHFRFANQRSSYDYYVFGRDALIKHEYHWDGGGWWHSEQAHVSLNWLLDDRCEIVKVEE